MPETDKIICSACGGEVVETDHIDTFIERSAVVLLLLGECSCCGKSYQWHEEYVFSRRCNLEPAEDEVDYEPNDIDDDCGFDPYLGCYTDDC